MNIEPDEDAWKEILGSQSWMDDDELRLLNNIKAQLPRKDKKIYRTRLEEIDWEEAAFGNFTAGDCKSHFEEILTGIKSVKKPARTQVKDENLVTYSSFPKRRFG
nr:uncharacterized protein LOC128704521 [Cherax quadricarinatus]